MDVKFHVIPARDGTLNLSSNPAENSYGEFSYAGAVEIAKVLNQDLVDAQTGEVYVKRSQEVAARDQLRLGAYNATQGQGVIEWLLFLALVAMVVILCLSYFGQPVAVEIVRWLKWG